MLLSAVLLSSASACNDETQKRVAGNDDNEGWEETRVDFTQSNKLVVRSNVDATFSFDGQTMTGTEATFETTADAGTLKATAAGKRPVEMKISFATTDYQEFEVALVSMGNAVPAAVAEAAGAANVENGATNAAENDDVTASFNVGGNSSGVEGDYSVTVFTPEDVKTNTDAITTNSTANEPVFALDCQPDGAMFRNPIAMEVRIPDSNGFSLRCESAADPSDVLTIVEDWGRMNIFFNHFSVWNIVLEATVASVTKTTQAISAEGDASTGSLEYKFDYGFESTDAASSTLVTKYLKKLFGVAKKVASQTIEFEPVEGGIAKLTATQDVNTYTFISGNMSFSATVYGKVDVKGLTVSVPSGISEVKSSKKAPSTVYNLQGQKLRANNQHVEKAQKGLYIIDHKKVAVK